MAAEMDMDQTAVETTVVMGTMAPTAAIEAVGRAATDIGKSSRFIQ
jgi:hypothetical protein